MIKNNIFYIVNIYIIVPFLIYGAITEILSKKIDKYTYKLLNWRGIIIIGSIGTVVHELSHLIAAIAIHRKIKEIKLLRPIAGKKDKILGYVKYENKKGLLSPIGDFFISVAPMIVGTIIIYIIVIIMDKDIVRCVVRALNAKDYNISIKPSIFFEICKSIKEQPDNKSVFPLILLTTSISSRMSMSITDIRNSVRGLIAIEVLLGITAYILYKQSISCKNFLYHIELISMFSVVLMIIGTITMLATILVLSMISRVKKFNI